jgi:penicillin-binding protein 2
MNGHNSNSTFRYNLLFYIVFILFAILVGRLGYVQLIHGEEYLAQAESFRSKSIPINASRGLIKDINGEVLVNNIRAWTITFEIDDELNQNYEEIAGILAKLTSKGAAPDSAEFLEDKESILKNMDVGPVFQASKYIPRIVKRDVDDRTRAYIEEHRSELPGVNVINDEIRDYIYDDFMAQVIGYTRGIPGSETNYYLARDYKLTDRVGRYGLEKQYEDVLRGQDGSYQIEISSSYLKLEAGEIINPVSGNNLILTVDRGFQQSVEKILEKYIVELNKKSEDITLATAVVLDLKTGAVRAMGNYPRYNPNWFNDVVSTELYQTSIMPYEGNTAIRGRYEIGSASKPVTILAGLETGAINAQTVINDQGRVAYDKNQYGATLYLRNYGGRALGSINLQNALKYSSNVFMGEVSLRMAEMYGIDQTMAYYRYYGNMLGLGAKTGIDLPEELTGIVANNRNYVMQSIGQNDTYTALQLAQLAATIGNGGYLMEPYLVEAIEERSAAEGLGKIIYKREPKIINQLDVKAENLRAIQQGMELVTGPGGTAAGSFYGSKIKVAAKTGTAEVTNRAAHTIITGYAPADNPEMAFSVIVPYGDVKGFAAGNIAREIVDEYFRVYR